MMKRALFLALAVMLAAALANADTIGTPTNPCPNNSCQGNTFTLTETLVAAGEYSITLSIDTSGFSGQTGTGGTPAWLNAVDFKVASAGAFSLVSSTPPAGYNNAVLSNLSVSGADCTGATTPGFICFSASTTGGGVTLPDGTLDFTALIDINASALCTTNCSIQALYLRTGPHGKIQGQLTSEQITLQGGTPLPPPVPEPASLLLLGSGLLGAGAILRRKIKQS